MKNKTKKLLSIALLASLSLAVVFILFGFYHISVSFLLLSTGKGLMYGLAPALGRLSSVTQPASIRNINSSSAANLKIPGTDVLISSQKHFDNANTDVVPTEIVVGVTSVAGAGAVATQVSIFQQDLLNNVTDNSSGAGTITYTFQDGFAGRLVSEVLSRSRAAVGQIIYGYSITFNVASTGADFPAALNLCNPSWTDANCYGNTVPFNTSAAQNHTRKDFDKTIEVIEQIKNAARWSQFNMTMQVDSQATLCFYTHIGFAM